VKKEPIKLVVTAGPTREHLDPARFLSNPSTGKMGFAIAEEASSRGWQVVLVSGPVSLPSPAGVKRVDVVSARDMLKAVREALSTGGRQVLISAAAIADWRPKNYSAEKLKKHQMNGIIELVRNPDVLKTIKSDLRRKKLPSAKLVGFAAETRDIISEAQRKCRAKRLEFVVANDISEEGSGFSSDTNRVSIVYKNGDVKDLSMMKKRNLAAIIVDEISSLCL
jgi:phosphopantothenoylcysteine decarboxylase/phosphopantothenate--cysteine ligase